MSQQAVFYVWLTAVTDAYSEQIAGRLVRRGWGVASATEQMSLRNDDNLATMVTLKIAKAPKSDAEKDAVTLTSALADVKDVLKVLGVRYHSVLVTETCGATWSLGNMTKSELAAIELDKKNGIN